MRAGSGIRRGLIGRESPSILDFVHTRRHFVVAAAALGMAKRAAAQSDLFKGWPGEFDGERLRRLPMTLREQRLLKGFPGRFGRFESDSLEVIFRWSPQSTRSLRTSREVFAYDRFVLTPSELRERPTGGEWTCFEAEKGLDRLRICERITDEEGNAWADFDAWYEEAVEARITRPPWTAVTVIERLD